MQKGNSHLANLSLNHHKKIFKNYNQIQEFKVNNFWIYITNFEKSEVE